MRKLIDAYYRLLDLLLVATVAILIIPVTLQIFSRYTALIPRYIWTEELARFLFIWMIMLGAMVGVRDGTHFDVDVWPRARAARQRAAARSSPTCSCWCSRWCSSGAASEFVAVRLEPDLRARRAADVADLHRLAAGRRHLGAVPGRALAAPTCASWRAAARRRHERRRRCSRRRMAALILFGVFFVLMVAARAGRVRARPRLPADARHRAAAVADDPASTRRSRPTTRSSCWRCRSSCSPPT